MSQQSPQKPVSSFVPNSTSTPNDYFDLVMGFLSGNEWKVLSFAIRHILGFHDRITTRTRAISLSTFEHGYGKYNGVQLNRKTIIDALRELEKYQLLIPVGEATSKGQEWHLYEHPDLEGLKDRYLAQQKANKKNGVKEGDEGQKIETDEPPKQSPKSTKKVAQVVQPVHQQVVQPVHQSQCSEYTDTGVAATHNNILPSKPLRKTPLSPEKAEDTTANTGLIIQAWLTGIKATSSAKAWGEYNRMIAQDMVDAGITPADVTAFLASPFWAGKTPSLPKVSEQIGGWKAQQTKLPTTTTTPRPMSPQEIHMERILAQEALLRGGSDNDNS